jgi:hypothetical protein
MSHRIIRHHFLVSNYVEEHEELKTALTKWGIGETGFRMRKGAY